jgi:hypothetical protein
MNTDAENWKYDVLLLKIYSIYFRDDYRIMIKPIFMYTQNLHHTHTHIVCYIVVWRPRGDGSALFDVLALSWLLLWISLSPPPRLYSVCAKTFFTHDNDITPHSHTHWEHEKCLIFQLYFALWRWWWEFGGWESIKQLI